MLRRWLGSLLLLLLAWPPPGATQEPRQPMAAAACGPDGCYAAYFQRRSFPEAWHSCQELGGTLATLKQAEEAALVEQLLRRAAPDGASPGAPARLLWIGLQRQPRQCFPLRPLRGFAWATGDQDTAYTNWARSATAPGSGSCAAPRCVVLDERELRWLEGSCTVPVDGFLCRFAFRGMCAGLAHDDDNGDGEEEEEGSTVIYTTPFGPAGGHLRYVPFGTVAAVTCGGGGPAVSVLCLQRDGDGAVAWSKEPPLCRAAAAAAYPHSWCEGDNGGCQQLCLDEGSGYACECHAGYFLLPDGHSCEAETLDSAEEEEAEERGRRRCLPDASEEGGYRCRCPAGYEPSPEDRHQCEDVDECADEAPCEHQCENTEGSFFCRCHLGFSPAEDEPGGCGDTDECQIPGVCQQMCVNYVGGFECYCTEGYDLEPDGISCSPLAPLATAHSPDGGGGGFFQPFGLGWPQEFSQDAHGLDPGLALADHLSVFQDAPSDGPPTPTSAPLLPRRTPEAQGPGLLLPSTRAPPTSTTAAPPSPAGTSLRGIAPSRPSRGAVHLETTSSGNRSATDATEAGFRVPPSRRPPALADLPAAEGDGAAAGGVRAPPPTHTPGRPQPRDDRWLLVALLVPICVFLVIMLALGIVYCTRCGAQAKARRVTQCYRWVISSAGKGAAPSPAARPGPPTTCRTSV
uniref:CD248 molecule n=1 Tax=Salvator merianae TaxID=96440 RepID=A0A8D0E484_SALMN